MYECYNIAVNKHRDILLNNQGITSISCWLPLVPCRKVFRVRALLLGIKRSRLGCFVHLIRMYLRCLLWRPRTPWLDYISHLATELLRISQEDLGDLARDKDIWVTLLPLQPGPG